MKILCSKEKLHEGIGIVQKAVSAKSTLPILEGILVEAGDKLKLTGNDLEIGIECTIDADILTPGSIVLNSRIFGEIVRKLPDSEVLIEYDDNQGSVTIECENSTFRLKAMSPEGFPALPEVEKQNSFTINRVLLKDMIRQTIFAVGKDEYRPILMGSMIECVDKELNMVALDGFRIALRRHIIENDIPDFRLIVPGKTLNEVAKILHPGDKDITVYNSQNQVLFDAGDFKVVSRLLEGEFFNYRNAIPDDYETKVTVNTDELLQSIERAYLITIEEQGKNYPIDFNISEDRLVITSNTTRGSVREVLDIELEGADLSVSFNPLYFLEALRSIDDDKISIFFRSVGACTLKPIEGEAFTYMILPLLK